jgi:CubicO group peptidase (beta-lactamase class C family)
MMKRRLFLYQTLGALGLSSGCSGPEAEVESAPAMLNEGKLDEAAAHTQKWVDDGELRAASLTVGRGSESYARGFGEAKDPNTIFLLASITKPMTAVAMMVLADRGELKLEDPVHKFIPEFTEGDRKDITIKDILSHTSGLPDQLPENVELRKRFAPLEEFVERAIKTPLLFKPGTEVKYQSMGLLLASEVAQRITKQPFRKFLKDVVFSPLGMNHTELGLGDLKIPETAQSQVDKSPALYGGGDNSSWDWNSQYWRDLGAPWGGAHSTGADLTTLLNYLLDPDDRVLNPPTAQSMIVDHNQGLNRPWGIGFGVEPGSFAKGCSDRTFGHSGATGTLFWADPATKLTFVMLTTLPAQVSREPLINPVSDMVSEAVAVNV